MNIKENWLSFELSAEGMLLSRFATERSYSLYLGIALLSFECAKL